MAYSEQNVQIPDVNRRSRIQKVKCAGCGKELNEATEARKVPEGFCCESCFMDDLSEIEVAAN